MLKVKIEIEDLETQGTTTISFAVSPENLESIAPLPIGEIIREGLFRRLVRTTTNEGGSETSSLPARI